MATKTIPLAFPYSQRGRSNTGSGQTTDSRLLACFNDSPINSVADSRSVYLIKRSGKNTYSTNSAGDGSYGVFGGSLNVISAFQTSGATPAKLYADFSTNSLGQLDTGYYPLHFSEALMGGITYVMFTATDGTGSNPVTGWFYASDTNLSTFTGDRTSGSAVVVNVSSISGRYVGQKVTATGFAAGTRIASIDSATQITLTNTASSGSATSTTFTPEAIAKIINANFPTDIVGQFTDLNGRFYIMTARGRIYGSDLNTPVTWTSDNYIPANSCADAGVGCIKYLQTIVGFGFSSIEFFKDAGNSSGSQLQFISAIKGIGAYVAFNNTSVTSSHSAICEGHGNVYWYDKNSQNVYTFDGMSPRLVSQYIGASPPSTTGFMAALSTMGKRFVFIRGHGSVLSNDRWICVDDGTFTCPNFSLSTFISQGINGTTYLSDAGTSGRVFTLETIPTTYQDNGSSYTMTAQTEPYALNGGKPFTIISVDLLADTQSSGSTTLKISTDDYASQDTLGAYDLTKVTKRISRPRYVKSGQVSFQLTDSGNNAWRGQALVVNWEPATA